MKRLLGAAFGGGGGFRMWLGKGSEKRTFCSGGVEGRRRRLPMVGWGDRGWV